MSKSIRIRTTPNGGEKRILVPIEQEFDFIEILSLKITQEEVYRRFCADYGVVVGRVSANGGFGVPNTRVSIFIPLDSEDENNSVISTLYPYKTPYDKDANGIRYNLLPNTQQDVCHTPVGTFPSKTQVLDNDDILEIYEKYYKYTTTTNHAGDYMIFGVPLGRQTIHVDVDLSDIGILSQRPYDFIRNGTAKSKFQSPTKFKSSKNLNSLPQIVNQNVGLDVIPFWGDPDNCQVGINRIDVDLNYNFEPSAIFMGSIFGDNEKNSVNTRCHPRKDSGKICETVATTGSIEMLRKTLDGKIERFDVEGGRVIDDNGAWAYQVPMNLDYMVTDEFGNLIPSEDPTRGIPTRTRVRFRISMDQTGGEGKQRTRAKFLVPNNPNKGNTDYIFDETTPDTQFVDLKWNQLYTVRNHISRYQKRCVGEFCSNNRNFTGLKDVDDCDSKTPFPFNRMDTDINFLFSFLMYLIIIITTVVVGINYFIVPSINLLILAVNALFGFINIITNFINNILSSIINGVINAINFFLSDSKDLPPYEGTVIGTIDPIPYVKCIVMTCNEANYAPGCVRNTKGLEAAQEDGGVDYFLDSFNLFGKRNDGTNGNIKSVKSCAASAVNILDIFPPGNVGYIDCQGVVLAERLNVYEFDFYNDWVNGTLYSFLLRYKKKKNGTSKFCEYDCKSSPTNDCENSFIVDTCKEGGPSILQLTSSSFKANGIIDTRSISDVGLIKKIVEKNKKETLYYAAENNNGNILLYATDLLNLGSVMDCDINGIPKIHPNLSPTSYNRPPLTIDPTSPISDTDEAIDPLLMIVSALGINTCQTHCINIRRICELGVEIPNASTSEIPEINNDSIEDDYVNDLTRDVIAYLNGGTSSPNQTLDSMTTKFNSTTNSPNNYSLYRNFPTSDPMNPFFKRASYFFYFGIVPGASALELANSKYFTECPTIVQNAFILDINTIQNVTTINGNQGQIKVDVDGGSGTYVYSLTNTQGVVTTTPPTTNTYTFTLLEGGSYSISVSDSLGKFATGSAFISEPVEISFTHSVSNVTSFGATDGEIMINSPSGGAGPYTATIVDSTTLLAPLGTITPITVLIGGSNSFTNLPSGYYNITLSDNGGVDTTPETHTNVFVGTPVEVSLTITDVKNITCHDANNGSFKISASGQFPLSIKVYKFALVGTYNGSPYTNSTQLMSLINATPSELDTINIFSTTFTQVVLSEGYYVVKLTDSNTQTIISPTVVSIINPTAITYAGTNVVNVSCYQGDNGSLEILSIAGGISPYKVEISPKPQNTTSPIYVTSNALFSNLPVNTYTLSITDDNGNGCYVNLGQKEINEPEELILTLNSKIDTSGGGANGEIHVSATGGKLNLSMSYQFTILPISITNTTGDFTGLASGIYTVKVVDDNLCEKYKTSIAIV